MNATIKIIDEKAGHYHDLWRQLINRGCDPWFPTHEMHQLTCRTRDWLWAANQLETHGLENPLVLAT